MSSALKGLIAFGVIALVLVGGYFVLNVSYNDKEANLRTLTTGKQDDCAQILANGWTKVKAVAKVQKSHDETLKKIVEAHVSGRAGGGSLAKSLTEAKIELPPEIYKKVMTVIEESRNEFQEAQTELIALRQQHQRLVRNKFARIFLDNTSDVKVTIVTSDLSKEAYSTGADNNTDPYSDK